MVEVHVTTGLKFAELLLLLSILVSSCASHHNLKNEGANYLGGGFRDKKIAPRFYKLTVKTNFSPWTNFSGAQRAWGKRARQLCENKDFESLRVQQDSYNTPAGHLYIISQIKGYILCSGSGLEKKEIERLIAES
ncbi:MAG: hypothetical protein V3W04_02905 [Gammaproteobacteria bacterium]